MVRKIYTFIFFVAALLLSELQSETQTYEAKMTSVTKKLDTISAQLSSDDQFNSEKYSDLREQVVDLIEELNEEKQNVSEQISHSTAEEKESLEITLEQLSDTSHVATNILNTIDKKEIQTTFLKYLQITLPLYSSDTLKKALTDGLEISKTLLQKLHLSLSQIAEKALHYPYALYWSLWALALIIYAPISKILRNKAISAELKSSYLYKIKIFIAYLITGSIIPLIFVGLFLSIGVASTEKLFPFDEIAAFYLTICFIWLALQATPAFICPKKYNWSLVSYELSVAKELSRRLRLFLVFLSLRLWLNFINHPLELTQYLELSIQILLSAQAYIVLRVTNFRRPVKWAIVFLAILNPLFIFIGYGPLADLILNGTLLTLLIYLGFKCLSYSSKKALTYFFKESDSLFIESIDLKKSSELMIYWIHAVFNIMLFLLSVYGAFIAWGIDQTYLNAFVSRALFGFRVGTHTISLINIFSAAIVFLVSFLVTKYIQGFLAKHVFPFTKFDSGIKHTLKTTVGYIGYSLALIFSIRTLGFNLSSLLFILGGLSVGIGLGLQPIVTNFISGLIMLIERPIKIGDFIEIGEEMGIVKNINVRTTEIESFEKCSVFYPNTQVIGSMVKNWTKNDRIKRIEVTLRVKYGTDTKLVESILLKCAEEEGSLLDGPAPYVVFSEIGESGLSFVLRCYLKNLDSVFTTGNNLRHNIVEALNKQGIKIAYPQTEVHFDRTYLDKISP